MVIITRNTLYTKIEVSLNNGNKIQIKLYLWYKYTHTLAFPIHIPSYLYHNRTENKTAQKREIYWLGALLLSCLCINFCLHLPLLTILFFIFLCLFRDADWELMSQTFSTSDNIDEQFLNLTQVACTRTIYASNPPVSPLSDLQCLKQKMHNNTKN